MKKFKVRASGPEKGSKGPDRISSFATGKVNERLGKTSFRKGFNTCLFSFPEHSRGTRRAGGFGHEWKYYTD